MDLPTTVGGLGTAGETRIPASAIAHNPASNERADSESILSSIPIVAIVQTNPQPG